MSTPSRVYLAGPMTGIPKFNFPAFEAATAKLRGKGLDVVSPHELDEPEIRLAAAQSETGKLVDGKIAGHSWGDILARDVKVVADNVGGIVFLDGWARSRGAKLEAVVGLLCNHRFYRLGPDEKDDLVEMTRESVRRIVSNNL